MSESDDRSATELLAIGDCYALDGCYEEAIDSYAACLAVAQDKDKLLQFRALSHKSSALFYLKRHKEALQDAQSAKDSANIGTDTGRARIHADYTRKVIGKFSVTASSDCNFFI